MITWKDKCPSCSSKRKLTLRLAAPIVPHDIQKFIEIDCPKCGTRIDADYESYKPKG